jgi:hypothetical protein
MDDTTPAYESPAVEDIDVAEGPASIAAGSKVAVSPQPPA